MVERLERPVAGLLGAGDEEAVQLDQLDFIEVLIVGGLDRLLHHHQQLGPRRRHLHAGGLDNVATVLAELAEKLDGAVLASLAPLSPVPWAQRLGYLLEQVGAGDKAERLAEYVAGVVNETTALMPSAPPGKANHDARWRLLVNVPVEPDL